MGLLTSLLTEHMRGKREKEAQAQSHKLQALTSLLGNENVPDPVHEWAWNELQSDKAFKDMKPVIGMIQQAHGQLKQPDGQQQGQGAPQLPPVPGMPPMDVKHVAQPQGPPPADAAPSPPMSPAGPQYSQAPPSGPPQLPPMPQTVTRMTPSMQETPFRPVPPVPGTPDTGGGQPTPSGIFAAHRKQKQEEALNKFRQEKTILHENRLGEIEAQAFQRGDKPIGTARPVVGPDGKPHLMQMFMGRDHETYEIDRGEVPANQRAPQKAWFQLPGSEEKVLAWVTPGQDPVDVATNQALPKGVTSTNPPTAERLYGAVQGYYYDGLRLGMSHDQAKAYAGGKFAEFQGAHLARLQQQQAIDQALSGIGPGRGFSAQPSAAGAPAQLPPSPAQRPSTFTAAPLPGRVANAQLVSRPGTAEAAAPSPAPATAPTAPAAAAPGTDKTKVPPVPRTVATVLKPGVKPLTPAESKALDTFWGVNAGTIPKNRQTTVPTMAGMEVMKKITGLSGLELQQKLVADKDSLMAMSGMYRDYTSGPTGKSIEAMNTALGHLGELHDATEALKNGDIPVLNRIANRIGVETGQDATTTFRTIVHRVGPEIAKAYIAGGGTAEERTVTEKDFDPSLGAQQILSNIAISGKLFDSKINAAQNRWGQVFKDRPAPFQLSSESKAALKKMGVAGGSAGPQKGDKRSYQGHDYEFDGTQWKRM